MSRRIMRDASRNLCSSSLLPMVCEHTRERREEEEEEEQQQQDEAV